MIRVIEGDALATLCTLPDASAQCCVTSPPYYGLRDYGMDGQIGLEDTPDAYVARLVAVFGEVRRVLRDDGTLFLNLGDSYAGSRAGPQGETGQMADRSVAKQRCRERGGDLLGAKPKDLLGIPWQVAFALRADGWFLRSDIIWHKPNPMPESVRDRPTSAHEHVFLLSKRASYFYDAEAIAEASESPGDDRHNRTDTREVVDVACADGGSRARTGRPTGETRNARNVWTIASQPYSGAHFATMPPDIAERCIKAGTSERGQCPHCSAPWVRIMSTREYPKHLANASKAHGGVGNNLGGAAHQKWLDENPRTTTGWAPSCACADHQPVRQTVLDPFGGAGTTGLVADRLGRNAVLCELNPTYAALARQRISADAPLIASVA